MYIEFPDGRASRLEQHFSRMQSELGTSILSPNCIYIACVWKNGKYATTRVKNYVAQFSLQRRALNLNENNFSVTAVPIYLRVADLASTRVYRHVRLLARFHSRIYL